MQARAWLNALRDAPRKKPLPVLSFPCVSLLNITVKDLIADSGLQAEGMRRVAERADAAAAVSFMDLSVEAEAFGCPIRISDDEVRPAPFRFQRWARGAPAAVSRPSKRPRRSLPTGPCSPGSSAPSPWPAA